MSRKKLAIHYISDNDLQNLIDVSSSILEIINSLNMNKNGSHSYTLFHDRVKSSNLDITKLNKNRKLLYSNRKTKKVQADINEIFVENSKYTRSVVKRIALQEELLENKCSECGLGAVWNGKTITLHLDHINGINTDNRLDNLRMLCPNCHSQTPTYAGRNSKLPEKKCNGCGIKLRRDNKSGKCITCYHANPCNKDENKYRRLEYAKGCTTCMCGEPKSRTSTQCKSCDNKDRASDPKYRKVEHPSKEQLIQDLIELPWTGVGKKYGVSDNAVRKWAVKYELGKDRKKIIEQFDN